MNKYLPFLLWISVGLALLAWLYISELYPLDVAMGFISRAQAAGYAESMIRYLREAVPHLPNSGNPVWIFPTPRTDFNLIHGDLKSILDRLEIVANLGRDTSAYSQSLNDIRGKLGVIVNNLGEAMPYVMLSPVNSALLLIWFLSLPIVYRVMRKWRVREVER
jgi:hypothetical protein